MEDRQSMKGNLRLSNASFGNHDKQVITEIMHETGGIL